MAVVRIGTSGYQYDHWRGVFYPQDVPKRGWFAHYAQHFDTVEINNTFYRLPEAETFDAWRSQAPPGFCYAVKFSRYGTHMKRLKDPQEPIQRFIGRARHLRSSLGPILVQLPPRWGLNLTRLEGFLQALPPGQRWVLELRDARWLTDDVYALLARHRVALCIHDMLEDHPWRLTAPFVYLRFHGRATHDGNYSSQYLSAQARRIAALRADGHDVYAYFNNDLYGYAVANARDLKRYVARAG
ncbi:DUF72 domain-containing protein [Ectothiorhodospiraceae bacterium 2226]|nr:DUF72 domain-containing protein [Ectothiorhodospiraceae bacterium 2226]